MKKNSVDIDTSAYLIHSKEHALRKSNAEGCAQSIGINMSSGFLTPFLLAIGGNSFQVGLLSSLNGLGDPAGEFLGSKMMQNHSRKNLWMYAKLWIVLLQIPVLLLGYFFWKGIFLKYLPWIMVAIWGLAIPFIYGVGYVAWMSWLGDLIPRERKGDFFSKRNKLTGIVGLITFLVGGFLLDLFKTKGFVLLGFTLLFGFAIVFRLLSAYYTSKIFNPYFRVKKQSYFSVWEFIKRKDNYRSFVNFQSFFFFAMMLAAPFFSVYMLEELHFDYIAYTLVSLSSTVFYLIFSPLAGKFSDRYGNIKLMYFGAMLFPIVPLMWMYFTTPFSLIIFPGLISGLANAAFVISVTDFSYDATTPEKRSLCFAYTALFTGVGTLLGSFIGGWLVQYLNISFMKPLFFVFILSSVLMIISALVFIPRLKEERKIQPIRGIHLDVLHPVKTVHTSIVWARQLSHWQPHLTNKSGKK